MSLNDYLKKFEEQPVQEEREIEVVGTGNVEALCEAYEEYCEREISPWMLNQSICNELISELVYSSKDVTAFSIELAKYQQQKNFGYHAGSFLSSLMISSVENDFTIITTQLKNNIHWLGYNGNENIRVIGNVGDHAGYNKRSGRMIIEGDTGGLGNRMTGGEIHVSGEIESLGKIISDKARIYHKGKLIWPE